MSEEKTKEALDALERILAYTNGLGDGEAYTIRAALTAQDVNEELLEALKEVRDAIRTEGVLNNMKYDELGVKVYQAIASAEGQKAAGE